MARIRVSGPARADVAHLLAVSHERWGAAGRSRYAKLLAQALRTLAEDPHGPATRARDDLLRGARSFHLRSVHERHGVRAPVHVVYYRPVTPDVIEVVRILHERMDPVQHVGEPRPTSRPKRPRR